MIFNGNYYLNISIFLDIEPKFAKVKSYHVSGAMPDH